MRCPDCDEDIRVGTGGPKNLASHQGGKLCRNGQERKAQLKKRGRTQTLFDIGITKATAKPKNIAAATSSQSLIHVATPAREQQGLVHDVNTCERKGCSTAWGLLQRLRDAAGGLELLPGVPEARDDDELASFGCEGAVFELAAVSHDEVWEAVTRVNPRLDRLLGFGRPKDEICTLIRRGLKGVKGLCGFLEYLVEEKAIVGGLLEGKVTVLLNAMNQ